MKKEKRGRETSLSCLLHVSNRGPGPQTRHVPLLGIKPVTFQFTGQHSTHLDTPARAIIIILKIKQP